MQPIIQKLKRISLHRWLAGLISLALLAFGMPYAIARYVRAVAPPIYRDQAAIPPRPIAIVFGAGVTPQGVPTAALADRVIAATELYKAGKVQHLLMTGDNSTTNYDEVTVMRRVAIENGVPAEAITLDYAGFRSYDSCVRARAIFGVTSAILVTQDYHLPRALYTCQHVGVDVVGLAADARPDSYQWAYKYLLPGYTQRERLATILMLWQVHITHPSPRFLGPAEPIVISTHS